MSQSIMTRHFLTFAIAILVCVRVDGALTTQAPVQAGSETDRLVRAVLEESFASGTLPDIGLLPRWARIPVVTDVAGLVSPAALPQLADWKFELQSRDALETTATKSGQNLYYASVARVRIDGAVATLWVGVNFVEPRNQTPMVRMCCCGAQLEYRKSADKWTFSKLIGIACA